MRTYPSPKGTEDATIAAIRNYHREKAQEGIPVKIDADPEVGVPLFVNLEHYSTFNPVYESDRPETPEETLRRCRLELPGHSF